MRKSLVFDVSFAVQRRLLLHIEIGHKIKREEDGERYCNKEK